MLRRSDVARWTGRLALTLCAWAASSSLALAADGPKPGDRIDRDTWQKAEGLLPPEILRHYREGEYANPVVEWKEGSYHWSPEFREQSAANRGKFDVDADGGIVEKATGKQPARIYGYPFPDVQPTDPQAALKILWNYFYITLSFGNLHAESQVNWVSPTGLERRTDQDVRFFYYDGQVESESPENPQNLQSQQLIVARKPNDLNGTAALAWRSRDPKKRDSAWAFVPALRRVRSVSPSNRSDGFLGSDMSQDDGPFFDGKPEDFTWTFKGEVEQLRFVDPLSLEGKSNSKWQPGGGWRAFWPEDLKMLGYQDSDWKGVAWAPISGALAKRKFYVIEGIPKDQYYLFGRIELFIDKETFQGAWNRKFDWKGELLTSMQVMAFDLQPYTRPDGRVDYIQGSNMAFQAAENVKANRATVAGLKSSPNAAFDVRAPFSANEFTVDALSRVGK